MSIHKMNIVIPMAGAGSRFRDAGYEVIKPLINILGKPMYSWATDSLPLGCANNLIFILLDNQTDYKILKDDIEKRYEKYNPIIISVSQLTRGQSETVLKAKDYINNEYPLLIHNADTGFTIKTSWIEDLDKTHPDGALLVFFSREKRWSFSKQDVHERVVEVREKDPISDWASTGTYYWRNGSKFVELADKHIGSNDLEAGEFYIAPLFNDLIKEGGFVKNYPIETLYCFGTPEDVEKTLRSLIGYPH